MSAPNLFIVGAMKAGTSTLHTLLGEHPEIFMSTPKEPCYFSPEPPGRAPGVNAARDLDNYLALFAPADSKRIVGESSTDYAKAGLRDSAANRIYRFNPDARIVYLVRDPVARAISHYWWNVAREGECRPMLRAMREDPQFEIVSHYAMQLDHYFNYFPKEQIKVLVLEEMTVSPLEVYCDLLRWLGAEDRFVPRRLAQRDNETPDVIEVPRVFGVLERLRHTALWDAIGAYVPRAARAVGRSLATRATKRKEVDISSVVEYLRPIQLPQVERLSTMVGRDFLMWSTLYGWNRPIVRTHSANPAMAKR